MKLTKQDIASETQPAVCFLDETGRMACKVSQEVNPGPLTWDKPIISVRLRLEVTAGIDALRDLDAVTGAVCEATSIAKEWDARTGTRLLRNGIRQSDMIDRLRSVAAEHSRDDCPPTAAAIARAEALMRLTPEPYPFPEPGVQPDGDISLDWFSSKKRGVSVSVGATGPLGIGWIMEGVGSGCGSQSMEFDDRFPPRLKLFLKEIYG